MTKWQWLQQIKMKVLVANYRSNSRNKKYSKYNKMALITTNNSDYNWEKLQKMTDAKVIILSLNKFMIKVNTFAMKM